MWSEVLEPQGSLLERSGGGEKEGGKGKSQREGEGREKKRRESKERRKGKESKGRRWKGKKGEGRRGEERETRAEKQKDISLGANITVRLRVDTEFTSRPSVSSGVWTEISCPLTENNWHVWP